MIPLQITTNALGVVVVLFVSLLVSVVLSLVIGLRGGRRYYETRNGGVLLLTLGIVLLSGVPTSINVALTTFTDLPGAAIATLVDLVRLLGLVVVLVTIYDT